MGINTINIIDDSFVQKNTPSYNLSVLISADRFSYAVTNAAHQLLALKSFTLNTEANDRSVFHKEVQNIFIEDEVLKLPYNNTYVGLANKISTLVPNELFTESETQTYLNKQTDELGGKTIQVNMVNSVGAKNIYAFDSEVFLLLRGYFPNANYVHSSTALIESALKNAPPENDSQIYLNIHSNLIQIILLEGKQLIFSNNFSYFSTKDLLYYVMLVFDQFKLSPEDIPLNLSGHIEKDSEVFRSLHKYIKTVNFNTNISSVSIGDNFASVTPYYFLDLFSLRLCAL